MNNTVDAPTPTKALKVLRVAEPVHRAAKRAAAGAGMTLEEWTAMVILDAANEGDPTR